MFRRISAIVLALTTATLLAGCITIQMPNSNTNTNSGQSTSPSPTTSSASSDQSSPPEVFTSGAPDGQCLSANLSTQFEPESSSMGHFHYSVVFTNTGSQTCKLQGFPAIQVVKAGIALGAQADPDSAAAPSVVSLAPGASASAQLSGVNLGLDGGPIGDSCAVDSGDGVSITPPHSTVPTVIAMPDFSACANPVTWMTIGPVEVP